MFDPTARRFHSKLLLQQFVPRCQPSPQGAFPGFGGEGKAPCGRGCQNVFLAAVQPRVILFYEAELNVTIEYTEATILQFSRLSFAVAHNNNKVA